MALIKKNETNYRLGESIANYVSNNEFDPEYIYMTIISNLNLRKYKQSNFQRNERFKENRWLMNQHIIGSLSLSSLGRRTLDLLEKLTLCVCGARARVCACLQAHVAYTEVRRPEDTSGVVSPIPLL